MREGNILLINKSRVRVRTQRKQVACSLATGADTRQELTTLPYGGAHSKSVFRQAEPGYQ